MGNISMLFVFLIIFTVFTLILGAGLLVYSKQLEMNAELIREVSNPYMVALGQATVMVVVFLFTAGAILFLVSAMKFLERRDD
jgi:hypothetical protein